MSKLKYFIIVEVCLCLSYLTCLTYLTIAYVQKYITFFLLKGFSKVLICGGFEQRYSDSTCEIIDLKSSATNCKHVPNYPIYIHKAVGGLGITKIICPNKRSL